MAGKAFKSKTVPTPFLLQGMDGVGPSRKVLKAGPAAVKAWNEMVAVAEREMLERAKVQDRAERHDIEDGLIAAERMAASRQEEPERTQAGPLHVFARDGLMWAMRKGHIGAVHYDAGLRFRAAYEMANGTGVKSCLADPGSPSAPGPKSGPTDAMLKARADVKEALSSLGTPLLTAYVQLLAGEGVTLSDPRFGDPKRVGDHVLPCRVAFDLLARGYGMIR